ncbi:MAG: helix-hairpin-helix domain-containing protein [Spirochaetes bacterium]|nr:helix-hairpin-helix domain-containing protein [Spirochaetota bacterium]
MIKIALILCISGNLLNAFDYRVTPPASLFPFRQSANDHSIPDAISNPAYLPRIPYPYLHCSGSRPYTQDGLEATTLRAGYAVRGFAIQAVWDRFGIGGYMEHVVEVNIAYMPIRYISIGSGVTYYNLSIRTAEASLKTHQADCRASIVIAPFPWIEAAFQQENIASLFIKKRRDLMFPEWSAGAALKPFKGLAIMYNINKTPHGYVNTIAASANVLKYFSLRVGYAREAMTCAGSISFIYKYVAASYGLKYHPHLGLTHTVGITLSATEMTLDSLSYGSMFSRASDRRNMEKVNINACSMETLLSVPGLDRQTAERIMKYRKTIGPLTRTGLLQIGLTEKDIADLLPHITGLAQEEKSPAPDRRSLDRIEKIQKDLFKRLVVLGVPAASALECADMALRGESKSCADRINAMADLGAAARKQAVGLCSGSR